MASPELQQLERELEAAAVQFSIAGKQLTSVSDADPDQAAAVSEARVVSAARSALDHDITAPIEKILVDSTEQPLADGVPPGQWRDFLGGVRAQLGLDRPPMRPDGPPTTAGARRWPPPRFRASAGIALVAAALAIGVAVIAIGADRTSDEECAGVACQLEAVGQRSQERAAGDGNAVEGAEGQSGQGGLAPTGATQGGITAGEPAVVTTVVTTGPGADRDQTTATDPTTTARSAGTTAAGSPDRPSSSSTSASTAVGDAPPSSTVPTAGVPAVPAPTAAPTTAPTTTTASTTTTTAAPTTTVAPTTTTTAAPANGVPCPSGGATGSWSVTRVAEDDVLNVRLGPGTGFSVVAGFVHDATGVGVYDAQRSGSWILVVLPGLSSSAPPLNGCGWAHSSFLSATAAPS